MTNTDLTASDGPGAGQCDNPVRGRGNAAFFVVMDRYINWIARHAKRRAFDGIRSSVICEIGPGVGANFDWYPDQARVIGIEPNPQMHRALRSRASKRGVGLELHSVGAERIPLEDESVDEVVCSLVLCTVPDPGAVLTEICRVLRPGGRFRFVEHIEAEPGSARRGVQRALRGPWAWMFEGCCLERNTVASIESAGFSSLDYDVGLFESSVFFPVNRAVWGVATR